MAEIVVNHDTKLLAEGYEQISQPQTDFGLVLMEKLGITLGHRVIDIGCGPGKLAIENLSELVGDSGYVLGVDPAAERIRIAIEKQEGRQRKAKFRVGKAEDISDVVDIDFDRVFMSSTYHWIPVEQRVRALRETAAILKPGGKFGITSASAKHFHPQKIKMDILNEVLSQARYQGVRPTNVAIFPEEEELKHFLEANGFCEVDTELRPCRLFFKDKFELITFMDRSCFGNFRRLDCLDEDDREVTWSRIDHAYAALDKGNGITVDAMILYAVATKE